MADMSSPSTSLASRMTSQRRRNRDARHGWRQRWLFALNFLRHPLSVGTLFRSSPALVQRLADSSDWSRCETVVELGPGVGTVTRALLDRLGDQARLLAIESNRDFVTELRRCLPDPRLQVVHGSAADLSGLLAAQGLHRADALVSGIPFSTLPAPVRSTVLDAAARLLAPDGELLVYQHSGLLLPLLRERFAEVEIETEWRSMVPMRVFRCRRPRAAALSQVASAP